MRTTIFLNEGTEIMVKESEKQVNEEIRNKWKTWNFINVTMINEKHIETKPHEDRKNNLWEEEFDNSEWYNKEVLIPIKLNEKRILFFYES